MMGDGSVSSIFIKEKSECNRNVSPASSIAGGICIREAGACRGRYFIIYIKPLLINLHAETTIAKSPSLINLHTETTVTKPLY